VWETANAPIFRLTGTEGIYVRLLGALKGASGPREGQKSTFCFDNLSLRTYFLLSTMRTWAS